MYLAPFTFHFQRFKDKTMFAFHANAANQPKSAPAKKSKELKSKEGKKERKLIKEPDHVKRSSAKLTREQMREMLGFVDVDSHEDRARKLAAQATLPEVLTLSLRFEIKSVPIDDPASDSEQEPAHEKVLEGASIVALDKTVRLALDHDEEGRPVLMPETVQAGLALLLGIDTDILEEYTYFHRVRENEDLARPFGSLIGNRELQIRKYSQCDLCFKPICSQKGPTIVGAHKFNGHALAACTDGGCVQDNHFDLPFGSLTVFRHDGGLAAAFAPTGQKPFRLVADFTSVEAEVRTPTRAPSPEDTDDEELPSPKVPEFVMVDDDDDDKPLVSDKKRKLEQLEQRLSAPAAKKPTHYQPQAQVTKDVPQTKAIPSVTEPEPAPELKEPKAPEQKEQPKVQPKEPKAPEQKVPKAPEPKALEPTATNVADDEHAKLAKLLKALCGAMSVNDACNVAARVAAFWHEGPAALGSCIASIDALKCSNEAIRIVAVNWPRRD
jgi:hypothetical protein